MKAESDNPGRVRPDSFLIWTRIDPDGETGDVTFRFEVATDPAMSELVASGDLTAEAGDDWTVTHEVTGVAPATHYYYQFISDSSVRSVVGRTKTAPSGPTEHLRFAVASCSRHWTGFWNASPASPNTTTSTWCCTSATTSTTSPKTKMHEDRIRLPPGDSAGWRFGVGIDPGG